MCLDGRAAALLVAGASMVAGVADRPGEQPAATPPSAADPSPPGASTAWRVAVRVAVRPELADGRAATDLSGIVRDDGGRVVAGAAVLVVPDALRDRARTSRPFGITSGADGRSHRRGLPAGEYHLRRIDPDDGYGGQLLPPSSAAGAPLVWALLAAAVTDLRLMPPPVVRCSPAR